MHENSTVDHFVIKNGVCCAGKHLIIDMWGAQNLCDPEYMEVALKKCVEVCDATLLHIHLHHFGEEQGVTGVAVLAESHITVHTWPERSYAAFDIFMCGDSEPERSIPILQEMFTPTRMNMIEELRGAVR